MDFLVLLAVGVLAGLLAGLFGIGGGLVVVPIATFLLEAQQVSHEIAIKVALATSMATIVVTALSSIYTHHRKGAVDWGLFKQITPGILLGSALGALLADMITGHILYLIFTLFLFAVAFQLGLAPVSGHRNLPNPLNLFGICTAVGVFSALLGIGGGTLNVPFLSYCSVPIKRAIATAAAIGFPIAVSATLAYILVGLDESDLPTGNLGYVNLPIAAVVVMSSVVFAPVGALLAHRLPSQLLRRLFAIFLIILALRMAYSSLQAF